MEFQGDGYKFPLSVLAVYKGNFLTLWKGVENIMLIVELLPRYFVSDLKLELLDSLDIGKSIIDRIVEEIKHCKE